MREAGEFAIVFHYLYLLISRSVEEVKGDSRAHLDRSIVSSGAAVVVAVAAAEAVVCEGACKCCKRDGFR